jgi:hypothetical protein
MPSTPAVRAPRFPRTRPHATSRNAGSATRLNRSSNRRSESATAHWCSLVCIRSTRAAACLGVGHGAPVFTSDLLPCHYLHCESAAALRHVPASRGLGLLRRLRHAPAVPTDDAPAHHRPGRPEGEIRSGRFPRSPCPGRRVRCPALPLRPRHEYAAALPRGLPTVDFRRQGSRPPRWACTAPRPLSARFEPVSPLERRYNTGSSRAPSRLACRTRTVWQCQPVPALSGLLPPSPASPGSGCPQLHRPAATGRPRRSLTPIR